MRRKVVAALAAVLVAATIPVIAPSLTGTAAADPTGNNGATAATAGASCWGIKTEFPTSADGLYWLYTPALGEPEQFYCDMTTEGGGWVLVGRGREGWNFTYEGQGSPANVRNVPSGTAAFTPAALSGETVNELLNNASPTSLTDGVRVKRAANTSGTSWQEVRMRLTGVSNWSWTFDGGMLLSSITVAGTTYQGSNTRDTNANWANQSVNGLNGVNNSRRLWTYKWASHDNKAGFTYGKDVRGTSSGSSYLWENAGENYAIPFAQVFIRPRIANDAAGFSPIPANGYPAEPKPFALKQKIESAPWGVTGLDRTDEQQTEPWYTPVAVVKPFGDRVFVGGRFANVQQGPTGSPIPQRFLAAFDRVSGNWLPGFTPRLDGRVWDLVFTPDGKVIIGGDFTSVNGVPNTAGLAKIDPVTGAVDTTFKANLRRDDSSGYRAVVRSLDVADGALYAGGRFNRLSGGTWNEVTVANIAKVQIATGTPVTAFKPNVPAIIIDLDASAAGDRVHLAGYFDKVNGDTAAGYFATVSAANGSNLAGQSPMVPTVGANAKYQQTVLEVGDHVYLGGSEHDLQKYNRSNRTMVDSHITKQGGDYQDLAVLGGKLYAGCHCADFNYEGSNHYSTPQGYRDVDSINLIGQYDLATFDHDEGWQPSGLKGDSHGEGVWAIEPDQDSCLWVGGDLVRRAWSGDPAEDWLGNFGKFCPEDSTVPTTPGGLSASRTGSDVTLNWGASSDNSGLVQYFVYRNDRVIAVVSGTSYVDPGRTGVDRYTVRAVDGRRNLSASTTVVTIVPTVGTLVPAGSTWRYVDNGAAPDPAWKTEGFNDAAWLQGPAQLGWGDGDEATLIGAAKPATSYFRRTFNVASTAGIGSVTLGVVRDDAAAVYVNGVEAARFNLPAGALANTTLASSYISGADEAAVQAVVVPPSLLHAGTNTIAVELHQADATNGDASFDLSLTAQAPTGDSTVPTAPVTSGTGGAGAANLSWTASTDAALAGYIVKRDGQDIAVTAAGTTSYVDGGLGFGENHQYSVVAFDTSGNTSAGNSVGVTTTQNPLFVVYKSTWKYRYDGLAPDANWAQPGHDDSAWTSGVAELGYGDNDEATVISTAPTPRPLVGYFRKSVNIANPTAFSTVLIETIRDDGAVVYVNGVEVGRDNLPAGAIDNTTNALAALSTRAQETAPYSVSVPSSLFVPGANTIAVEVHNSDRWSGDFSFDLRATGQP